MEAKSMEPLPEDVVLEILVRVTDISGLFRCAVTCTRWRLLIANGSFLRRRWPEGACHRSSLLGFFSLQKPCEERIVAGILRPMPMPPFTPAPWSPFGRRYGFPDIPEPLGYHAVPLTSRRGLLLVYFCPNSSITIERYVYMAVCDPLSRKTRALAPLEADGRLFRIIGCTILTHSDCCSNHRRWPTVPSVCDPAFFKVLIVSYVKGRYSLHVFTSGDFSWSTPIKFFDHLEHLEVIEPLHADAVVCKGTAHWLYKDKSRHYTLNVSTVETAHISLTNLPIAPYQPGFDSYTAPMLSVTDEGVLSVLRLHRKCTGLEIWTHQADNEPNGDSTLDWHLTKLIGLKQPDSSKVDEVQCVCVGEMSGELLIKDNKNCMYIADLEAGTMENVTESFHGVVKRAIPFEMDWPAFFMSRLEGGTIKRTKLGGAIRKVANLLGGRLFGQLSLN